MFYTILMYLSVDLSMHFVKAFAECFPHFDIFYWLQSQASLLKSLPAFNHNCLHLALNRVEIFLQWSCAILAITLKTSCIRVCVVLIRTCLYVRLC